MKETSLPQVTIYTDGACSGNPGPGGWGAVLRCGQYVKELKGGANETTNNRMELTAAIEALKALKRPSQVELWTDSKYLKNGVTKWMINWKQNNWRNAAKKPIKNKDLWQNLESILEHHHVVWRWLKGHAGHLMNERADELARMGMSDFLYKRFM